MELDILKKINWNSFRIRCPRCGNINVIKMGIFKQIYNEKKHKFVEAERYLCRFCKYEYWK